MTKLLFIDDDKELGMMLVEYVEAEGFSASAVHDGVNGIDALENNGFDLVVLDIMMPGLSGIETLKRIRTSSLIPVIMLTAKGDELDRILGLELGADDYVTKPCNPRELVARIRAVLRRSEYNTDTSSPDSLLTIGALVLDSAHRSVSWNKTPVELTSTEFNILRALAARHGTVVTKQELYKHGLQRVQDKYDRSLDVHVSSIRKKLGKRADGRSPIETIRGIGYQYISDQA